MADANIAPAPPPPKESVPPEEEVPPLFSSTSSCCWGGVGGPGEGMMDDYTCCHKRQGALQQNSPPDMLDDNMSSSLQRQVDDLFDQYCLSPVASLESATPSLPRDVNVSASLSLPQDKRIACDAPLSPLSFHASIVDVPSFESDAQGEEVDPSITSVPAFRVLVLTSSSSVTVELVAEHGSRSAEDNESHSGEEDDELKTVDVGDGASFGLCHRKSRTSLSTRLVWLVPATRTGCGDGDDSSTSSAADPMMGIEIIPQKTGPDDVSCDPSTTCSESSDGASAVVRLSSVRSSQPDECDDDVPVSAPKFATPVTIASQDRSVILVKMEDTGETIINNDTKLPAETPVLPSNLSVENHEQDGNRVESAKPCDIHEAVADDVLPVAATSASGDVADAGGNDAEPSTDPDDVTSNSPDSEPDGPAVVESGQSILDAAEDIEEEKLEDVIVLSFASAGDVDTTKESPESTPSLALVEHQPAKTTARRVRSLLNGMFEIDDSDHSAEGGQRVQVKNVVQRIEEKMVVRRRTVTGNRHFKVSRTKISDDGSDSSRTTASAKITDPVNLTCRLILRLASSDTESDALTSEDSSTILTGSYLLSVGATNMTQGGDSKRMEDVKSFVMMFSQLKAVETRQERWERRFQHVHVGPSEKGELEGDADHKAKRVAARCTRLAERLKEINGTQIIVPDDRERRRLKAEYRRLEKELEQYGAAFMISQIHREEQESLEAKWEIDHQELNSQALKSVRRYMPVNIRTMNLSTLARTLTPNGKILPAHVARKFKVSTTILQLLRIDPKDIERMHPSVLEDLRMVDLTLVERRALHSHMKDVGAAWEKRKAGLFSERRWAWFQMLKSNFKEELALHSISTSGSDEADEDDSDALSTTYERSCTLINPESNIDYQDDYGFPEGGEYEVVSCTTPKSSQIDFAATLNELRKTENEADEVDFFAPLVERMKGLDNEAIQFQNDLATLEDTIRSLGICHSVHEVEPGKQISSSESSSTGSTSS